MKVIITSHNKKLLKNESSKQSKPCNCKNKDICTLNESCQQQSIVHQVDIFQGNTTKSYIHGRETNLNCNIITTYNHLKM